ncbi:hypothetical protein J2S43_002284 [Catenuloplanes nepalensis]|uniref:Uncharacterized protein n=1 Tax=Catenuloplanes nepalensis TaxID=587533 RepID=A0ABT9MQS9_9ACTN|nr:hypothetical protein [Catenuloplanes nepalensis]MDP9793772.1 hypothetical protein [Catenuloplanes nepalensis]
MAVQELGNQTARNDAGVTLSGRDRTSMFVEYGGATLIVEVDRAPGDYAVYLPAVPTWTDGTTVPPDVLGILMAGIVEIMAFWRTRVEFPPPRG